MAISVMAMNGFEFQAARPECLADPGSDFPFYYAFSIFKVAPNTRHSAIAPFFVPGASFRSRIIQSASAPFRSRIEAFRVIQVALPLAILLAIGLVKAVLQLAWKMQIVRLATKHQHEKLDKLEVLETVVFQVQLTSSWRAIGQLICALRTCWRLRLISACLPAISFRGLGVVALG